ncbi:hypothetical protein [Actinomadura gamaensis]|uniref:PLL-like beta propeller domain-containing protein n=1 Tax=Actinomadura gamaensis TaxID=1763541 RepID=A0ABV9UAR0_9ACTN
MEVWSPEFDLFDYGSGRFTVQLGIRGDDQGRLWPLMKFIKLAEVPVPEGTLTVVSGWLDLSGPSSLQTRPQRTSGSYTAAGFSPELVVSGEQSVPVADGEWRLTARPLFVKMVTSDGSTGSGITVRGAPEVTLTYKEIPPVPPAKVWQLSAQVLAATTKWPPALTIDGRGRAVVFAHQDAPANWAAIGQTAAGAWSAPEARTVSPGGGPVAATSKDGRATVFWREPTHYVKYLRQTSLGADQLTLDAAAAQIPNVNTPNSPVIALNADGRFEPVLVGMEGAFWHAFTTGTDPYAWAGAPAKFGGFNIRDIAAATRSDGRIAAYHVNTGGDLWQILQTAPNAAWATTFTMPLTGVQGPPALHPLPGGGPLLAVFAATQGGAPDTLAYAVDNGTDSWGPAQPLVYDFKDATIERGTRPDLALGPDGKLLLAVAAQGTVTILQQPDDLAAPWITLARVADAATGPIASPSVATDGTGRIVFTYVNTTNHPVAVTLT